MTLRTCFPLLSSLKAKIVFWSMSAPVIDQFVFPLALDSHSILREQRYMMKNKNENSHIQGLFITLSISLSKHIYSI